MIIDTRMTRALFSLPRALAPGGIYVAVGATTPSLLGLAIWGRLLGRVTGKRFRMLWLKANHSTSAVATLAEAGVVKPYIDCVLPLAETAFAMKRFGAAEHRGKIVIGVAE